MNVTCQDCRSVFRVDPAKVPPNGVRARCSVCGAIVRISVGATTPLTNAAVARSLTPLRNPTISGSMPAVQPEIRRPTPAMNEPVMPNLPYPSRPTPSYSSTGMLPPLDTRTPVSVPTQPAPTPFSVPPIVERVTPEPLHVSAETIPEAVPAHVEPLAPLEFLPEPEADTLVDVPMPEHVEPMAVHEPTPVAMPMVTFDPEPMPDMIAEVPEPMVSHASAALPEVVAEVPVPEPEHVAEPTPLPVAAVETALPTPRYVPPVPAPMPVQVPMPVPVPQVVSRPLVPLPPPSPGQLVGMPEPTPASAMPAVPASGEPRRVINPFLRSDPMTRAKRLARALVSDMVAYQPAKRADGLANGTLKQLFRDEIRKSYDEYVEQVGREVAESTAFFQDALNEVLAEGKRVF